MLYTIIGKDAEDSRSARAGSREDHIRRIRELLDDGRLVLAGPMPAIDSPDPGPAGYSGSLVVGEFDSLGEARRWAESDPYLASGAWLSVEVRPFVQVMP